MTPRSPRSRRSRSPFPLHPFLVAWLALALPLLLLSPPVAAQLTAEDHDRARSLLADGRTKRAAGEHLEALASFREAHAIEKLSTTGYEVGRTLADLGRLLEARDVLRDVATAPGDASEPPPIASARVDARQLVDKLDRRIPTLVVKLDGAVDGRVSATIDGAPAAVELLGQPRRLDPGEHTIVIRRGRAERVFQAHVAEGQKHEVRIEVPVDPEEPLVSPSSAPTATARPSAHGRAAAPEARSHTIAWVAGGVALGALGVGAVTGVIAANRTDDLRDTCPNRSCPPPQHGALEQADNFALVSTIGFVTLGVAAAVLVWDLVRGQSSTGSRSL